MSRPVHRYVVRDRRQLKALESPARLEIVDGFAASGPCSIARVAREIGRTPESLYYHVEQLVRVGLLVSKGTRKLEKHEERLYAACSSAIEIKVDWADPHAMRSIRRLTRANLRMVQRDIEAAYTEPQGGARTTGPRRNVRTGRVKAWLGPEELERVNALLQELEAIFGQAEYGPGRELLALGFGMARCEARDGPRDDEASESP